MWPAWASPPGSSSRRRTNASHLDTRPYFSNSDLLAVAIFEHNNELIHLLEGEIAIAREGSIWFFAVQLGLSKTSVARLVVEKSNISKNISYLYQQKRHFSSIFRIFLWKKSHFAMVCVGKKKVSLWAKTGSVFIWFSREFLKYFVKNFSWNPPILMQDVSQSRALLQTLGFSWQEVTKQNWAQWAFEIRGLEDKRSEKSSQPVWELCSAWQRLKRDTNEWPDS